MSIEVIFFILGCLAYSAALWYEFYKIIRDAKKQQSKDSLVEGL